MSSFCQWLIFGFLQARKLTDTPLKVLNVLLVVSVLVTPGVAEAELTLVGKNRVIFEKERLNNRFRLDILNQGERPALANISIEWGDARKEEVPMAVSSPLVRIAPAQQKSIELFYQGKGLPNDRESYFLLSILDVPIAPQQENALQIALRHRFKVFFRPRLDVTQDQAAASVTWKRTPVRGEIEAGNPSPYYLTITNLIRQGEQGRACGDPIMHTMLTPFSKKKLASGGCFEPVQRLQYSIVTDSGREVERRIQVKSEAKQ
ncbi:molecular chaperone [Pseudomonas chlororaphis subsp. aurantiaca]|nr:molecular chaperone [Pseudomonas chlororaphis subsp. aurantiaca]